MASPGLWQFGTDRGRKGFDQALSVRAFLLVFALAPAVVGCAGAVGEPGGPPDNPSGGGNSGGGGNGVGGNGPVTNPGTDPGRVTLHRLNKVEYNNTVSDLVGTALHPANDFPADNRAVGYDNIADALSLSDVQLQLYQNAAEAVSEVAMGMQRSKVVTCDPVAMGDACVRSTIQAFGKRAWRRPITDDELTGLMTVAGAAKLQNDTPDVGIKLAIQALLLSPNFIFRIELDSSPTSLTPHALTEYELASRLSYFLWSSMPDDQLFAAADAGNLHDGKVLSAQVTRMLQDPKATALVDNFAGQWLFSRQVMDTGVDKTLFPKFDDALRAAMLQETKLLFRDVAFGGASAEALLTADYTYMNDRLASHYGLPPVGSTDMKKATLADTTRGGLLAQGSFLTVTSHPTVTSPVNRGKAILTQLLCTEVPDPPPGVNTQLGTSMTGTTRREQLESHRNDPKCSSCHSLMDPLGFGLENYDAVGAYRTMDNGSPVDSKGTYPGSTGTFSGARELAKLVAGDARFPACVTQQLYTYALGRAPVTTAPDHMDPATIQRIANQFSSGGYKFETLVQKMVASDTFLKRRGEAPAAGGMQ
jgi:hypothetical protein